MIESVENALQIGMLSCCVCAAGYRAIKTQDKTWALLSFFFGSLLLGDVYWLVCLIFFEKTPDISVVSDLSWYASYMFLYMLLRLVAPPKGKGRSGVLPLSGPIFALGMAVFYIQWGEILSNLIYAALMGHLLYASLSRLCDGESYAEQRPLAIIVLVFCLLEYALWTSSCIWKADILMNPYYWCDFLMTLSYPLFLRATRKAVPE